MQWGSGRKYSNNEITCIKVTYSSRDSKDLRTSLVLLACFNLLEQDSVDFILQSSPLLTATVPLL